MKPIIDKMLSLFPNYKLFIEYRGEGDSGDVFDIRLLDQNDLLVDIELRDYISHREDIDLRDFVYNILETRCPGWEINEGSEGSVTFYKDTDNTQAIKTKLEHGERRVEIDWTEEEYFMSEL